MYYFNLIIFYSLLGFILESVVYKISKSNEHSSIFYGPYTLVYGFGVLACILVFNFLNNFLPNNFLKILIYYLLFTIITTIIEYIGGHLIHYFLKIDKWNYSNHKYHFGKYICLDNSLYWGILSLLVVYYLHPYFNKFILNTIPNKISILVLIIFLIDLIFVIMKKIIKR